jgi:tetratricopeptide (TPR) repeat protein
MSDLYRSANVLVRSVPAQDQSRWVVTFDHYGIGHGFDRLGFGEAFFKSIGVSAVHVMGVREDWYQYAEMPEAMAAVREALSGAERVITYGSSMGAYAAIRFADAAGAHAALALSPQYSIDPAKAPFERRWSQDSDRIQWLAEIDGPIQSRIRPLIIYDPATEDSRHLALIEGDIAVSKVKLRNSGHPTTTVMADSGVLSALLVEMLAGEVDPRELAARLRRERRKSSTYLATVAERQPTWRSRTALALARQAYRINPANLVAITALAAVLLKAGEQDEPLGLLKRAYEIKDGEDPHVAHHYASALSQTGRHDEAITVARRATAKTPHLAHLHAWESGILWASDATDEAIQAIDRAIALDPSTPLYKKIRKRYLRDLKRLFPQPTPLWRSPTRLWKRLRQSLAGADA